MIRHGRLARYSMALTTLPIIIAFMLPVKAFGTQRDFEYIQKNREEGSTRDTAPAPTSQPAAQLGPAPSSTSKGVKPGSPKKSGTPEKAETTWGKAEKVAGWGGPIYNAGDSVQEAGKGLATMSKGSAKSFLRGQNLIGYKPKIKGRDINKAARAFVQGAEKTGKVLEKAGKRLDLLDKWGNITEAAGSASKGDYVGVGQTGANALLSGTSAGGGAWAGGKAGAAIGTALGGPAGGVVGGAAGAVIGGITGSVLYDRFGKPIVDQTADGVAGKIREREYSFEKEQMRRRADAVLLGEMPAPLWEAGDQRERAAALREQIIAEREKERESKTGGASQEEKEKRLESKDQGPGPLNTGGPIPDPTLLERPGWGQAPPPGPDPEKEKDKETARTDSDEASRGDAWRRKTENEYKQSQWIESMVTIYKEQRRKQKEKEEGTSDEAGKGGDSTTDPSDGDTKKKDLSEGGETSKSPTSDGEKAVKPGGEDTGKGAADKAGGGADKVSRLRDKEDRPDGAAAGDVTTTDVAMKTDSLGKAIGERDARSKQEGEGARAASALKTDERAVEAGERAGLKEVDVAGQGKLLDFKKAELGRESETARQAAAGEREVSMQTILGQSVANILTVSAGSFFQGGATVMGVRLADETVNKTFRRALEEEIRKKEEEEEKKRLEEEEEERQKKEEQKKKDEAKKKKKKKKKRSVCTIGPYSGGRCTVCGLPEP